MDWAIVQTQGWGTLYVLSRERTPGVEKVEVSLDLLLKGRERGSKLTVCRRGFSGPLRLGRMLGLLRCLIRRGVMTSKGGVEGGDMMLEVVRRWK